jgi:uncharacterized damage-inducible protein DinB
MTPKQNIMVIERLDTEKLFKELDKITSTFLSLVTSTGEDFLDTIPFEGSWTIAQLASHITKSNNAIIQALQMQGKPAERNIDERVDELKKTFLNYKVKFQSPEFILPTKTIYSKQIVVERLKNSIDSIKQMGTVTDLSDVISLPAFGEITKYELLNFVIVHTKRHIRQLKNMLHYS